MMTRAESPTEIGLLLYPAVQLAAVHGLTDLFLVANRIASARSPSLSAIRVSHWQTEASTTQIVRIFDTHPRQAGDPCIILALPSLGDLLSSEAIKPFANWLKAHHDRGAILGSVCAGTFLLAETGLLTGRSATTHWAYAEVLAERFPAIHVDIEKLIIDDGDIITAGGLMSWTDLGLKLVDRILGSTIMIETARFLLVDPPGREQRYYSNFSPQLYHGDRAVLAVQHWLQTQSSCGVSLMAMAERAGLEERTFLRRFRKATGLKPTEYCQHLRVSKARELLEITTKSIDQISWAVGYQDSSAFRRTFQKIMGLSPGDYRHRFSMVSKLSPSPLAAHIEGTEPARSQVAIEFKRKKVAEGKIKYESRNGRARATRSRRASD